MTDKSKPPEGYMARSRYWHGIGDVYEVGLGGCVVASDDEAEVIAACWTHANRQRAIGVRMAADAWAKESRCGGASPLCDEWLRARAARIEKGDA